MAHSHRSDTTELRQNFQVLFCLYHGHPNDDKGTRISSTVSEGLLMQCGLTRSALLSIVSLLSFQCSPYSHIESHCNQIKKPRCRLKNLRKSFKEHLGPTNALGALRGWSVSCFKKSEGCEWTRKLVRMKLNTLLLFSKR